MYTKEAEIKSKNEKSNYHTPEQGRPHCYREVMRKAIDYNVLVPLVDEFGEDIMSAEAVKHVKKESKKIYHHYNILIKTINVKI